jgi:hypothetical protein
MDVLKSSVFSDLRGRDNGIQDKDMESGLGGEVESKKIAVEMVYKRSGAQYNGVLKLEANVEVKDLRVVGGSKRRWMQGDGNWVDMTRFPRAGE